MSFLGDYTAGGTVSTLFTTRTTGGVPSTLSAGTVVVYKDAGTVESGSGVTLTADFDARTGVNALIINTSSDGTFYSTGSQFVAVLSTGTVNSVSVGGEVIGKFTLGNQAAKPVLSVTGSVASVSGSVASVSGSVASVSGTVGSVAGGVGGNVAAVSGSVGGNILGNVQGSCASVAGNVAAVSGSVGGNVLGSVASVSGTVGTCLNLGTGAVSSILTTQMTESYASVGTAPSLAEVLFETRALLAENSVAGTVVTTSRIDGSTGAGTYALDSDTAPTSITRTA